MKTKNCRVRKLESLGRSRPGAKILPSLLACLWPALGYALDPNALPTGGTVASGAASISQAGSRLNVLQHTGQAILNWNTFNIGSQASVNFQQPSASSVVLNRVGSGGGVSEIYGSLTANGQVFLINPAGTLFGRGAQVNVGGLVASSLDISNENFLNRNYRFAANGTAGAILNQGTLSAADGGYIALLAPQVRNEGVVAARLGTVAFGAGEAVRLDINGTGLIEMQVERAALDALIANKNLVEADGGVVFMGARAAGQLAGGVINNSGEIRAERVAEVNGVIRLEAGDVVNSGGIAADGASGGKVSLIADNTTINSGAISARGTQGQGGEVRLLGDKVGLFGEGSIDASGASSGGTVLVGGNFQGKGPEVNASIVRVAHDASIRADAGTTGDGGKVIVWSNDDTVFAGSLTARGGSVSGNGGFAEVSGKQSLDFNPRQVQLSAANGRPGELLLDPLNIIVATGGTASYVDVSTFAAMSLTNQTISPATLLAVGGSVQLQATNDITVNNAVSFTGPGNGFSASAGNSININAAISMNNGAITLSGRNPGGTQTAGGTVNINAGGSLSSTGGAITITNNGSSSPLLIAAAVNAGAGNVSLSATGAQITESGAGLVNTSGTLTTSSQIGQTLNGANTVGSFNATNTASGAVALTNTGNLTINAISQSGGGSVTVTNTGTLNTGGAMSTTGGTALAPADISLSSSGAMTIAHDITTNTFGTVNLTVTGANTLLSHTAGALNNSTNGNVTLTADKMALSGGTIGQVGLTGAPAAVASAAIVVNTGSIKTVTLKGTTASNAIDLGSTVDTTSGRLEISQAELATINALELIIGNASQTGAINVSAAVTTNPLGLITTLINRTGGITVNNVLTAGNGSGFLNLTADGGAGLPGTITESAGATGLIAGMLTTKSGGGTSLTGSANAVTNFGATNVTSGLVSFVNTKSAMGVLGITQAAGAATTISNTGDLVFSYSGVVAPSTGGSVVFTASNDILLSGSGSSSIGTSTSNAGRDVTISAGGAGAASFITTGALNVTAGRDINVLASTSSANVQAASMNLSAGNNLNIQGGSGTNASAQVFSTGTQTVTANTINVLGGTGVSGNSAMLRSTGNQTVSATSGIIVAAGASGGNLNSGNFAQINASGNQSITVGPGGLTATGGGGGVSNTDNGAFISQNGFTGTSQTINVNGGGAITLTGGSSGLTGVGSGNGSRALIQADGDSQQINFGAGGTINLTGGTIGSRAFASIFSSNGSQTITGSPNITLTGGASGGIDGEGNYASIFAGGLQTITSGNMTLNAGAAGTNNFASISGATNNITVNGNLALTGGGSSNGTNGGGVGFGGPISAPTNLNLAVTGDVTLTGGSVAGAGIGSVGLAGGQTTNITINAGGNVTLTPGSGSGARIGSSNSNVAGGSISVTAGGAIALNDSATQGTAILTTGSVTLQAASISEGTNGQSKIQASGLFTNSSAGAISLTSPNNSIGTYAFTAPAGGVSLVNASALDLGLSSTTGSFTLSTGGAITQSGALTVAGASSISAGANAITLTNAANDFQGLVTLSNSGANAVQITDVNTINFGNMLLGGAFTVNAPTIIGRDTTNTGNQLWNGNVTFNSTETTNGGNFTVAGTTTLGTSTTINAGSGNVTFTGAVNAATAGVQGLTVNSSGATVFGSTVGATGPLAFLTNDAAGTSSFGGSVTIGSVQTAAVSSAVQSVQSVQSTQSIESLSSPPSAASPAAVAAQPIEAPPPAPRPVDAGSVRPTASSGVPLKTIQQIDQQVSAARTELFTPALQQISLNPAVADVPECGDGAGICVMKGKTTKPEAVVTGDAKPIIKRKLALLFGNDRYLAPIPPLETPINDVVAIGNVLKERLGYEARIVRNATREDIVNELNRLVLEADLDDSVIVMYAGHGYQAEKGGAGYWIPVDASNTEASTWLSNSAISKFVANIAARQVMLISDSCYSGTLAQEQKVRATETTVFDRDEILSKRSVMVMSSGGNEPVTDGGHDNHSLFAYHLIRSLGNIQGDLVGADIHERVRAEVVKEYPQDPQYGAIVTAGHAPGGEYLIEKKQ